MKIALFDYGAGNLHSLGKGLAAAGAEIEVTGDWATALDRDALVLPGVGAFGQAAAALPEDKSALLSRLGEGYPCLGICLGMQLLFSASDESEGDGIGLIPGRVERLEAEIVPQMGWNDVELSDDPIFEGIDQLVAYYANSYVCRPDDPEHGIAWSEYGGGRYAASARRVNSWGMQFHPEKSSASGRRILTNFVRLAESLR